MIVWFVTEYTPGYRIVNKDMETVGSSEDAGRLVGIYATEDEARYVQEELINDNAAKVIALGVDQIDVTVESHEIKDDHTCFYTERWYDEDLVAALESTGIGDDISDEAVAAFRKEVLHIFDDKTDRNEMLSMAASSFLERWYQKKEVL